MSLRTILSPRRDRSHGFSLILSLVVMAMLMILCIGAAALLTIELRVAKASVAMTKARLNALSAARIALGTLQTYAGADTRITAPSGLLAVSPDAYSSPGVSLPRLTGVWKGKSVSADYQSTHDDAFIGWLVSGTTAPLGSAGLLAYPKTARIDRSNGVHLVAAPARLPASDPLLADNDPADVYAAPEAIADAAGHRIGQLAWWIADENQKANLTLRIPVSKTPADALRHATNAPRFGLNVVSDGEFARFPETVAFKPAIVTHESLAFDRETPQASGSAWLANSRDYRHAITPYSESLLTDTVNGGLKYDLNLLLGLDRLPAGYRGDQAYVAMESLTGGGNPYAEAKGGWLRTGLPATAVTPGALLENNRAEWTCWGDVWNYARLYKHPAFNASGMTMNSTDDANGNSSNPLDPSGNVTDIQNLSAWREPVVIQMQVVAGIRTQPDTADPTKLTVMLVQRPYIQLWNPYNVPLKFTGRAADSILGRFISLPGKISVTAGASSVEWDGWASQNSLSGAYNIFQLYLNFMNQAPLAPGEVRVFSPAGSALDLGDKASAVHVQAGLRPFGGFGTLMKLTCNPEDLVTAAIKTPTKGWYGTGGNGSYVCGQCTRAEFKGTDQTTAPPAGREWFIGYSNQALGRQLLSFNETALSAPAGSMSGTNPRFFGVLTMRLRAESTANLHFPFLSYGDPLRWFFRPAAASTYQNNQDVWFWPYEFIQSPLSSDTDSGPPENPVMQCDPQNRGYAFTSFTPTAGATHMVFSHLPLAPLGSLADLRDARLGGGAAYTRKAKTGINSIPPGYSVVPNAFGNSYMHPMVPQAGLTGSSPTFLKDKFFDFSWIMNSALWDSYYMSGLAAQDSPVTALSDGAKSLERVASDFFIEGKNLPNRRFVMRDYGVGPRAMKEQLLSGNQPAPDGYAKAAATMSVIGGFNINSTSVRAWRALLAGLDKTTLATLADSTGGIDVSTQATAAGVPALRHPVQNGLLASVNNGGYGADFNRRRTVAGRLLSDIQLTALAQQIVLQVKKRGPFLSLGEFMNRRLDPTASGTAGALQAAIDESGINAFASSDGVLQSAPTAGLFPNNPAAVSGQGGSGSLARGMPGFITQADLIAPVATQITPRSDTFGIRVSGTSEEGAVAYMEIVVRRTAAFIDTADAPYAIPAALTRTANKVFGRRFAVVASRWMQADDL